MRYEGSMAGTSGDGNDVRLEEGQSGLPEATDGGLEGNSCESRSEPEVFLRLRPGRCWREGVPRSEIGDPTRRAEGTLSIEDCRLVVGEPTWRGDGTPSMVALCAPRLS